MPPNGSAAFYPSVEYYCEGQYVRLLNARRVSLCSECRNIFSHNVYALTNTKALPEDEGYATRYYCKKCFKEKILPALKLGMKV